MRKVIEEIMEITGWNQADLAKVCNTNRATVCRWLAKGEEGRMPSGTSAAFLADLLRRAKAGEFKQPAAAAS
jgi:hypothetical protein